MNLKSILVINVNMKEQRQDISKDISSQSMRMSSFLVINVSIKLNARTY